MGKVKLGVLLIITFFFGVIVGSAGSRTSTVNSTDAVKQYTTNSNTAPTKEEPTKATGKVEVKSHTKRVDYGYPKIVGEVVNNTTAPATFVKVIATFYDAEGKVVGTSFSYAGDTSSTPLQVEATTPFEITDTSKSNFDHYKLDVSWE